MRLWDRIASFAVSTQEKAILWAIARHANWDDGGNAFPSIDTLAREVGLKRRQVYQYLAWLQCDPEMAAGGRCMGGRGCTHRGLLVCTAPASRHYPAVYGLRLDEFARQSMLPEVGAARLCDECARPAVARGKCDTHYRSARRAQRGQQASREPVALDHGPYEHLIRRA